jgi:HptB-dependent secretion and biofilm anti anti-sigma factor
MPTSLEVNGNEGRIILNGVFDFSVQNDVREIINETLGREEIKNIIVDMAGVSFMDSSAIGLLLLLNDKAQADGKSVKVINCRDTIREIFSIGGFDSILTIQ